MFGAGRYTLASFVCQAEGRAIHNPRAFVVTVVLLMLLGLAAAACGSSPTSVSWQGTWVPTSGALRFPHHLGEAGLGVAASTTPGGGIVITNADDSYAVTLVSADGIRVHGKAMRKGKDLLVSYGMARYLLVPEAADRTRLLLTVEGGAPAPQVAATMQPGVLAPTPAATNLP